MIRFALKTLLSDRGKLAAAVIGVVFSLVLVNIQGGLFLGLIRKAELLIDITKADVWVCHRRVENVDLPENIHTAQLSRIQGLPNVAEAEPLVVGGGEATLPDGGYEAVWVIGLEPHSAFGSPKLIAGTTEDLSSAGRISIDEVDRVKLGNVNLGDVIEINGRRAKVAAKTEGLLGFMTTPNLFTNITSARRFSQIPEEYCSYFLVKGREGTNVKQLACQIGKRLPELDVFTEREFRNLSRDYWMKRTGIGISFGASTFLGILVGLVMVAQSLYALALDHLSDYATLKAMGADLSSITGIVFLQAFAVAAIGSVIGVGFVIGIAKTWSDPMAPIEIPVKLLMGSIALVFVICFLGAMLPLRRIRKVDPMMVLQG